MTGRKDTSSGRGNLPSQPSAKRRHQSVPSYMKASHRNGVSKTRSQGSLSRREAILSPVHDDGTPAKKSIGFDVPVRRGGDQLVSDLDDGVVFRNGLKVTNYYELISLLGSGGYSQVFKAKDVRGRRLVAVKVARCSNGKLEDNFRREIRILQTLEHHDAENCNRLIHSLDFFKFQSRICIVTPLYGENLHTVISSNPMSPLPKHQLQRIARQLLSGIAWFHDLGIVHTDLKPSNIVLVTGASRHLKNLDYDQASEHYQKRGHYRHVLFKAEIRIIDFGVAIFNDESHHPGVTTTPYRAPEITMLLDWSYPCDIWSIACTLVELFTGKTPLPHQDSFEHFAMIKKFINYGTTKRQRRACFEKQFQHEHNSSLLMLFNDSSVNYPNFATPAVSVRRVEAVESIEETFSMQNRFVQNMRKLLRKMFRYDPEARITAKEALRHEVFQEVADLDYVEEVVT